PSAIVVRAPPSLFWDPTAPAAIYPLSLHDALPICRPLARGVGGGAEFARAAEVAAADAADEFERGRRDGAMLVGLRARHGGGLLDRKSTRLNSSHVKISYAVFCLKKKKHTQTPNPD